MMKKTMKTMIIKSKFSIFFILLLSFFASCSTDLSHTVSGQKITESVDDSEYSKDSPYVINNTPNLVDKMEVDSEKTSSHVGSNKFEKIPEPSERSAFKDTGYTPPGTFEGQKSYLEIDKSKMAKEFRWISTSAFNLTYIQNKYNYESTNDVINKTIGEGYRHVKGGYLLVRSDRYIFKTILLNMHWSIGTGVGYNAGRGMFVDGSRSEATFTLWEIPVDLGLGLEIPLYHWFKISGTAGPSVLGLHQNRSDFQNNEKGKNKTQVSYGQFASAQFKINLTGFGGDWAHELFSESGITSLMLNLEGRYQSYQKFLDPIKVSGTSFGAGFTFEFL